MESRIFTDTALPAFSGVEGWYQHIHIVQAIVKSNGWPDETAALQLFVHLKGEALDVALLLKKKERESWTGLVQGLAAYYQSPGRLAGLRRRFESASRQPGLDPATFATDLGMLAIQGFGDMRKQARDTMIRDKFIAGQEQCALRRQLDGFAQDTPIGEIVDSCRVWESHSDSNRIGGQHVDLKTEEQSGDSRTWERNRVTVVVDKREPEMEVRKEVLKPQWMEDLEVLWQTCLIAKDWTLNQGSENERGFGRAGQPLGPRRIKAPLTLGGGGPFPLKERVPPWQMPRVDGGSSQWRVDGQEFPALGTQRTASKVIGSAEPGDTGRGRQRDEHPIPIPRVVDRGMRPAKKFRSGRKGNGGVPTRGVRGTLTLPLSPLAKSFTPRPTPDNYQNQRQHTDIDLHRSPATTGVDGTESPWNNIEDEKATIVLAEPIEIEQPVAMADVAEPRGPARAGAGGPVVTEIRMTKATDRTVAHEVERPMPRPHPNSVFSQETTEPQSVARPCPWPVVRLKMERDAVLRMGLPRPECGPELEPVDRS